MDKNRTGTNNNFHLQLINYQNSSQLIFFSFFFFFLLLTDLLTKVLIIIIVFTIQWDIMMFLHWLLIIIIVALCRITEDSWYTTSKGCYRWDIWKWPYFYIKCPFYNVDIKTETSNPFLRCIFHVLNINDPSYETVSSVIIGLQFHV